MNTLTPKERLKLSLITLLTHLRESIGALECKLRGKHQAITSCFEFGDGIDRFYPCERCGRDAVTGLSFQEWLDGVEPREH